MNADLEKAAAALLAERADEASVYAWNALATIEDGDAVELARLARELDDRRLLGELERRGLPTEAEPEAPAPAAPAAARRPLRAAGAAGSALFLLVVAIVIIAAVASIPVEGGDRHPTAATATSDLVSEPILTERAGVWLVPLGEPTRVDLERLAREVSLRYGVPVGVLADVALPARTLDEAKRALIADELIDLLAAAYRTRGNAVVIGLTDYDMYFREQQLAHAFALRRGRHYAVVSTSTLGASVLDLVRGHSRHERTRKLVAREVGFLYLRRPQVDDPHSLLRPTMHGADDIDKLNEEL